jgi:hypothetical protein
VNTAFEYLYRDAANWKEHFQVVFPGEITPEEEERLRQHLSDFKYFIAGDVGLPELQWEMEGFPTEDDHAWHELGEVRLVDTPPTCDTSIHAFVEEFCAAEWDEKEAAKRLELEA